MVRDSTFEHVAFNELREKGYSCRDCVHWMKLDSGEEACRIQRPNFPTLCRDDRYFQLTEGVTTDGRRI